MTEFTFLQLLDETCQDTSRLMKVLSAQMSVLNDSCVETLIPENDAFFPKCDTRSIGTQTTKKVQEKKEHNIKMLP